MNIYIHLSLQHLHVLDTILLHFTDEEIKAHIS